MTALYAVLAYLAVRDGGMVYLARVNRLRAQLGPETPKTEAARKTGGAA